MRGLGSIYLRNGVWWLQFQRHGRRFRMSAETTSESVAKNRLREELKKSLSPNFIAPNKRKVTIAELVADLIAHYDRIGKDDYAADCRARWAHRLQASFEFMKAVELTTAAQNEYRDKWRAEKTDTTINRDLQVLRRAYRHAAEQEPPKVERIPKFIILRENNARKIFITDEQLGKLRQAASKEGLWSRTLLEMAYFFGWRRGELLGLLVRDVNIAERYVRLQDSKNGDPRELPLTDTLVTFLQPLISVLQPEDRVFPHVEIKYMWKRICIAAGLKYRRKDGGITFHDFRRTAARAKRAAGVDTSIIMEMQGWKTEAMFRRYAIVSTQDKLDALRKLENVTVASQLPIPPSSDLPN